MQYRNFGRLGWLVGEIGYGMWGLAGWSGSDDDETSAALERAVELGCNFFDTAWAYGNGHSERLLGALVRNHLDSGERPCGRCINDWCTHLIPAAAIATGAFAAGLFIFPARQPEDEHQ